MKTHYNNYCYYTNALQCLVSVTISREFWDYSWCWWIRKVYCIISVFQPPSLRFGFRIRIIMSCLNFNVLAVAILMHVIIMSCFIIREIFIIIIVIILDQLLYYGFEDSPMKLIALLRFCLFFAYCSQAAFAKYAEWKLDSAGNNCLYCCSLKKIVNMRLISKGTIFQSYY